MLTTPRLRRFLAGALPLALAMSATPSTAFADAVDRHIVLLADDAVAHDPVGEIAADLLAPLGLRVDTTYEHALSGFSVTGPVGALAALLDDARVTMVERATSLQIAAQNLPAGIDRIDADLQPAAGIGTGQLVDVDVAVIDTGIDDHADLNLVSHFNCVSGLFSSGCKVGGSDGHGHGTHVAGTIGALDNSLAVVGVAPGARMHGYKVLNDLLGSGSSADIIDAIEHVTARGDIEVINMSLGGSGSSSATDQAIQGATDAGVVVVVAAGNDTANASGYTPANSPNAITVSAVSDTDGKPGGLGGSCSGADDSLASYSNYGDIIDIAAPGSCVVSLRPGGGTASMSGTSMAAPHVAGAAALWIAAHGTPNTSSRWTEVLTGLTTTWGTPQDGPCGYTTNRNADPMLHLTGCGDAPDPDPANNAPTVEISSDATTVDLGDSVTLTGSANDVEDGNLTDAIAWTSDLDGSLGTGATITAALSEGQHVVTASVADAQGATAQDTVAITVVGDEPPAPDLASSVESISYTQGSLIFGGRYIDVTVGVIDQEGAALRSTVTIEVFHNATLYATHTGTTNASGSITFQNNSAPTGDYTAVVTAIEAGEHVFDGVTPDNGATLTGGGGLFG